MKIVINYNSKWGNSFISEKNEFKRKEVNVHKSRGYIASSSNINPKKNKENTLSSYKESEVTLKTVYGILYRLLGARKPLEKVLVEDVSILKEMILKERINFEEKTNHMTNELVFLRNNRDKNYVQNSYSGIPDNSLFLIKDFIFSLDVLFYSREELMDFILKDKKAVVENDIKDILSLSKKIEEQSKIKENKITLEESILINEKIKSFFKTDIKEGVSLSLIALNKSVYEFSYNNLEFTKFLTKNRTLAGIALNGNTFTVKNFMEKFANYKIVYGNPYIKTKQIGKKHIIDKCLNKKNGILTINIDCSLDEARKIKEMIENAGVSAFYVGKKGLGYVDKIII